MTASVAPELLGHVTSLFEDAFGPVGAKALYVHAPGRSEIAGNHTDHEGGHVIAAALDVSVDGSRAPTARTSCAWPRRAIPPSSFRSTRSRPANRNAAPRPRSFVAWPTRLPSAVASQRALTSHSPAPCPPAAACPAPRPSRRLWGARWRRSGASSPPSPWRSPKHRSARRITTTASPVASWTRRPCAWRPGVHGLRERRRAQDQEARA